MKRIMLFQHRQQEKQRSIIKKPETAPTKTKKEKGMRHIWENWGEEPWQLVWYGIIQSSWETKELSSNLFISFLTQINLGLAIDTVVNF